MKFCKNVKLPCAEVLFIMRCVDDHCQKDFGYEITITSGSDSAHSTPQSRHYIGYAFDFRLKDLDGDSSSISPQDFDIAKAIIASIHKKERVPNGTIFVIEPNHIHCQYNGIP